MTFDASKAPDTLSFSPISFSHKDDIETVRAASGSTLYVYTFASLFSWQESEGYGICFSGDAFLIKYGARGENAYLFPCGAEDGKKRLIDALLKRETPTFYYIGDGDKEFLENAYPGRFCFEECRDDFPYLYDKDSQIALAGKENKGLRHKVNLGRSIANEWSYELMTEENVGQALLINRKWAEALSGGGPADIAAAETALNNFSALDMWGMLFKADGEDIAYAAGCFITPEIFDICFCKVLDKQCDCFIKCMLYRALPAEVKTVDSEEDMGLAGLRTHKLLRRPKELVRVWKGNAR